MTTWVHRWLITAAFSATLLAAAAGPARADPAPPASTRAPAATPIGQPPATDRPATDRPATDGHATGDPATGDPVTKEPATDEPGSATPTPAPGTDVTQSVAVPASQGPSGGQPRSPAADRHRSAGAPTGADSPAARLPATGARVVLPLGSAAVLLLAGTAAVLAGRRRRTRPAGVPGSPK